MPVMKCCAQSPLIVILITLGIGLTGLSETHNAWFLLSSNVCTVNAIHFSNTLWWLASLISKCGIYLLMKSCFPVFIRLDFTYNSNNWGVGLPPKDHNESKWPLWVLFRWVAFIKLPWIHIMLPLLLASCSCWILKSHASVLFYLFTFSV